MRVTLFDYTGAETPNPSKYAASILLFTKSTRLNMSPGLLLDFLQKPENELYEELKIMAKTNPGSWEYIDLSFLIEDVTRAFTHQLVRTRSASYAQQTMRVLELDDWTYGTGPSIENDVDNKVVYDSSMRYLKHAYQTMLQNGAKPEDARGVLPTNIHTNICMKINMRNFISMARKRSSNRVQDEHRKVIDLMVIEVQKVYGWFHIFYSFDEAKAFVRISDIVQNNSKLTNDEKIEIYKMLDIIKGTL